MAIRALCNQAKELLSRERPIPRKINVTIVVTHPLGNRSKDHARNRWHRQSAGLSFLAWSNSFFPKGQPVAFQ